jgi:CDP-diacylglycerol--glycerol-3-phosphate 3-phosphatidyltransferase
MFGTRIQREARHVAEMVVRPLAAVGLTPNVATFLGLLLNAVTAAVLAFGHLRLGGGLVLFAGIFDMFDGALARVRDQKTTFGAFFDSTLDRYSEGLVLLGILLYAVALPPTPTRMWVVALTYVTALSSLMVSYTKARAEGLGLECKIGLMARPERVLLLAAGLILGGAEWLLWTLLVLAATSTFTAVQRIVHVWLMLRRSSSALPATSSRLPGTEGVARERRMFGVMRESLASRPNRAGALDAGSAAPPSAHGLPSKRSTDH